MLHELNHIRRAFPAVLIEEAGELRQPSIDDQGACSPVLLRRHMAFEAAETSLGGHDDEGKVIKG